MSGDWLAVCDVAEALGAQPWEVLTLISAGELEAEPCLPALCGYHISEKSLEEYIARRLPVAAS